MGLAQKPRRELPSATLHPVQVTERTSAFRYVPSEIFQREQKKKRGLNLPAQPTSTPQLPRASTDRPSVSHLATFRRIIPEGATERLCVHTATQKLLLALVHHIYSPLPQPQPTTELLEGGQRKVTPFKTERGRRTATAYLAYLRRIITEKQRSAALWARPDLQPHRESKPVPQHLHAVKKE